MKNNIIYNYLKEKGYNFDCESTGLFISNDGELVIKGSKIDLIELANYIVNVALSDYDRDHLHLDDLTLLSKDSEIKNIIIEKE